MVIGRTGGAAADVILNTKHNQRFSVPELPPFENDETLALVMKSESFKLLHQERKSGAEITD